MLHAEAQRLRTPDALREKVHGVHVHAIDSHMDVLKILESKLHRLALQLLFIAPVDVRIALLFGCQRIELACTIQFSL